MSKHNLPHIHKQALHLLGTPERLRELLKLLLDVNEEDPSQRATRVGEQVIALMNLSQTPPQTTTLTLTQIDFEGADDQRISLTSPSTTLGTRAALSFEDDYLDAEHLEIYLEKDQWLARDLDSLNGSFIELSAPRRLEHGDTFLQGRQVLQFRLTHSTLGEGEGEHPSQAGVKRFGSPPPRDNAPSLAQLGAQDEVYQLITIPPQGIVLGKAPHPIEESDTFAFDDVHQSNAHSRIHASQGAWYLEDLGSVNGTWLKLRSPVALRDGDRLFVGALLFRVNLDS